MNPMIGFSGTRLLSAGNRRFLATLLTDGHLEHAEGFVTGACVGVDAFVGRLLADEYPEKRHRVVVPADRSRISRWWESYKNVEVIEMEPGTSYRDRNLTIIAVSQVLEAFPEYAESHPRSTRSGTWQTVRLARRHHDFPPRVWVLQDH